MVYRKWIEILTYESRYEYNDSYLPLNVYECKSHLLDLSYVTAHQIGVL